MPKGSRVLMADDDKMLIDMYKERLELAGYAVTICRNGEEALAKVRETKPDIVLLDIMMPKINGYEALASIKSDPQTKDIPVIMLSALMRDFNREKAVEAGADDYLIKSEAMPADVITKIEQVLSKYGKGVVPAPGMAATGISAPSATPPAITAPAVAPVALPIANPIVPTPVVATSVPTPPVAVMHPDIVAPNLQNPPADSIQPPVTAPEKIVFEPAPPLEPEVPVVKFEPKTIQAPQISQQPQPAPSLPWEANTQTQVPQEKRQKSPASMALIVILAILLTALINDVVIYYFFFMNR